MLRINLNSPVPIYEQLVDEIKRMIEQGEIKPGDSLPTIRSLSSQLDVAINTVARAYQELENLNLIESSGRKGSFVKQNLNLAVGDDSRIFKVSILKLIQNGLSRDDIRQIFEKNLSIFFD
ncbi:GntR family transcriptional regulator [candidate division KSB1 bacterium]